MNSPAHTLALYLDDQSIGTFGTDISVSNEPASPDDTITLYDVPGRQPLLYGDPDTGAGATFRPEIQVRVRGSSYPACWDKQETIRGLFHRLIGETIHDAHIVGVWMLSDIQSLGRDDNNRYRLTANYSITLMEA